MNDILSKIDWDLLREQKLHLIHVIDILETAGGDEDMDHAEALAGILNLLDVIMDTAHDHHFPVMFLTEDPEPVQSDQYQVRFRPQAWINDNAVDIDYQVYTEDEPVWFIEADSEGPVEDAINKGLDLDFLKFDPYAPEWVREFIGPFEIELVVEIELVE